MNGEQNSVIGTWAMIEAWDVGDNPEQPTAKTYPWGNPSAGYWVFDTSGNFGLMIAPNPALAIPADPFSGQPQSNWLNPAAPWTVPNELFLETFVTASPYAYFGTYTVEMENGNPDSGNLLLTVTHDIMRGYTGTVQTRPFAFEGPDIINVGNPGDGTQSGEYLRKLKRLS
ncbi:MAG TPA: hypothetical protein VHA56_19600 [Mucilaginibacter sp.]|nr:hypothetical protein [Mucilaginibacter sp.]